MAASHAKVFFHPFDEVVLRAGVVVELVFLVELQEVLERGLDRQRGGVT
jgi:hypothetical protein